MSKPDITLTFDLFSETSRASEFTYETPEVHFSVTFDHDDPEGAAWAIQEGAAELLRRIEEETGGPVTVIVTRARVLE